MTKRNAENERIKRRYLIYLKDAKGRDTASIDGPRARSNASSSMSNVATSGASISNRPGVSRLT